MEILDFYEKIRIQVSIADIISRFTKITFKGKEFIGLCPFHKERTPSFTVSTEKRFYHCFGCGAHGDLIEFYSKMNSLKYHDSAIKLAQEYNIILPIRKEKNQISVIENNFDPEIFVKFFQSNLTQNVITYLKKRGLNQDLISKFEIGYLPNNIVFRNFVKTHNIKSQDLIKFGLISKQSENNTCIFQNRIIFPIRNIYHHIIAFGGRITDSNKKTAKYLNSPETDLFKKKEIIYGEHIALPQSTKNGFIILVEGYLDLIILHKMGFNNTGGILGTALSNKHLEKIFGYTNELVICFDRDLAGKRAIVRLIDIVLPYISPQKKISFVILPENSDPGDLQNVNNPDMFSFLLKKRNSLSEMIWDLEFHKHKISTAEDKAFLEYRLKKYILLIKDKIVKNNFEYFFRSKSWKLLKNNNILEKKQNLFNIADIKNYSELELLEYIILSLVIFYPSILQNKDLFNKFYETEFKKDLLGDFKFFICEIFLQENDINFEKIDSKSKKTGFESLIMLISGIVKEDFAVLFSQINSQNSNIYFEFFIKKKYLVLLRKEYSYIVQNVSNFQDKRILHYVSEIHKIDQELSIFNEEAF
ncbi:MAG: DNA primase [Rickettsia sp.]|nr:DNA primase [Rickettsia sp.]